VLEDEEQRAPLWRLLYAEADRLDNARMRTIIDALTVAPLVIIPMASKEVYLARYAEPDKGWTDKDEASWPVPYWYIDTGFAALIILLSVVDSELGAVLVGPPDVTAFRAEYGVPPQWTPIGVIAVGHPDPEADPLKGRRRRERKPLTEFVHRGRW
jgi:nitroreductase